MSSTTVSLRIEGFAVLSLALAGYAASGAGWLPFFALLLVPDLAMLGYLAGPRVGAIVYNLGHLYVWPALLLGLWMPTGAVWALSGATIWASHIAMDRMLGYGLKEPDAFRHTHLGWLGGRTRDG